MEPKKGFFDKIDNAFFLVIDVFLVFLEERGWNIPEETRFLYHTAIFVFILWLGFPLILLYFFEFEAFVIMLVVASFCIANIMPIRKLLGYYSSEERVHGIVNRVKNNQVSLREVSSHLNKNLLPPHLTLSIIRAYQAKGQGIPPEIIRTLIRQPQETAIFTELIKEELNESDFSLLLRKYKNRLPKPMLLKAVELQKMDLPSVRDLFFYNENAYQVAREILQHSKDEAVPLFLKNETDSYKKRPLLKNFLRNHHTAISALAGLLAGLAFLPFIKDLALLAFAFALAWLIAFEAFYSFVVRELYFRA